MTEMKSILVLLTFFSLAACSIGDDSAMKANHSKSTASEVLPQEGLVASAVADSISSNAALTGDKNAASEVSEIQARMIVKRDSYQAFVEKQFPGFRLMKSDDFDESVRVDVKDGISGALIIGNFDFDKFMDYAVLLKGSKKYTDNAGQSNSYDVYEGLHAVCHGNEQSDSYTCEEISRPNIYGLEHSPLYIIPPGRYECVFNERGPQEILTTIDGIGRYSEKAGGFTVLQKDGTYFGCTDSD